MSSSSDDSYQSSPEAESIVPGDLYIEGLPEFLDRELNNSANMTDSNVLLNPDPNEIDSRITESINILARKFDILYGAMSKILLENIELKKTVEALNDDTDGAWNMIHDLEKDMYATQQYQRRENIEMLCYVMLVEDLYSGDDP